MLRIKVLDQDTINQIAAGEVIDRPASVVKELLENAIDAGATAVTVEIKEGGLDLIRVTDNGSGIPAGEVPMAFLRHATSKIKAAEDLMRVSSLGFRGEALSSIAAVAQVELITKTYDSLMGCRYVIHGGVEKTLEPVGAPEGTTFVVRNLFYNTPARRKFLKTPAAEGSYISEIVSKLALSRPDISIRFISGGQNKFFTVGNHNLKDLIYMIYGREMAASVLPIQEEKPFVTISGFIGDPSVSRGNRNFENYFINGRFIRSQLINKAIEEAYAPFMMQHKFPFTLLQLEIPPELLDVNVHPAKMELRLREGEAIYQSIAEAIKGALIKKEPIRSVTWESETAAKAETAKTEEPVNGYETEPDPGKTVPVPEAEAEAETASEAAAAVDAKMQKPVRIPEPFEVNREAHFFSEEAPLYVADPVQEQLDEEFLITPKARAEFKLVGQLFKTYWAVEYKDTFLLIDQHAAHEKVLFEKTMNQLKEKEMTTQSLNPPIIISLTLREEELLDTHMEAFSKLGFEIEPFGGHEYAIYGIPADMLSLNKSELFFEILDSLDGLPAAGQSQMLLERVATMSCKAAVKGGDNLSYAEAEALIDSLLLLDNPYACPHGRPTMITMTKYELEKKFKRIV